MRRSRIRDESLKEFDAVLQEKVRFSLMKQAEEKTIDYSAIMGLQRRSAAKIIHPSSSSSCYPAELEVRLREFLGVRVKMSE